MRCHFIPHQITYDGSQITSLWAYRKYHIQGDSIVTFIGPCRIPRENMVDLEDLKGKQRIYSRKMLHFIIEHFEMDLEKTILRQRLLTAIIRDLLEGKIRRRLVRKGNDIFDDKAKLSISIATLTPVSTKIHFGINIDSRGTPVVTRGLADYKITPERFAREVMKRYQQECLEVKDARCKVRGVQ